jgi:regulator of protease activity HflC (stomatin/prohibitin superfamily)
MDVFIYTLGALAVLAGGGLATSARVVKQIERGVVFRLGRVQKSPGIRASPCWSPSSTA